MIKAVIFDLDGTILDSLDALLMAFNAGVVSFKLEPVAKELLFGLLNRGAGLAEMLAEVYPELRAESTLGLVGDIITEIKNEYLALVSKTKLSSGVPELLAKIQARGIKMGVVTSRTTTPQRLWQELGRLQVSHFINAVATAAQSRRKPAPDGIIQCLKKLKLLPQECIFVGDSWADMEASKAAGVRTVAIANGVSIKGELEAASPDFIFDDLSGFTKELASILSQN